MRAIGSFKRRRRLLLAVSLVLLAGAVGADSGGVPLPLIPKGKGDQCVEPTPVIRRDHMVFLHHQRDETMHEGVRTKRHSLKECVECHVSVDQNGGTIPVNAPGQFCAACHTYAGVSIDCFQCHATTPDSGRRPPGTALQAFSRTHGDVSQSVGSGGALMHSEVARAGESSQ